MHLTMMFVMVCLFDCHETCGGLSMFRMMRAVRFLVLRRTAWNFVLGCFVMGHRFFASETIIVVKGRKNNKATGHDTGIFLKGDAVGVTVKWAFAVF